MYVWWIEKASHLCRAFKKYGNQWTREGDPSSLGGHECKWPEGFSIPGVLITAKKK